KVLRRREDAVALTAAGVTSIGDFRDAELLAGAVRSAGGWRVMDVDGKVLRRREDAVALTAAGVTSIGDFRDA
ncbi:hypothetical protein C7E17_26800, partial [Stenotrophomonas maltophilia]